MRVNIEGCNDIDLLRKEALRLQIVAESQGDTIHALRKRNAELVKALEYVNKACLCTRFPSRKMKKGFDYGEVHPVMGKCEGGSRWLTPKDKIEAVLKDRG